MTYDPEIFGRILSFDTVERAIASVLDTWFRDYLLEVQRQMEAATPGSVPDDGWALPESIVSAADFNRFAEETLPAIIVMCPGLASVPQRTGDGMYSATFAVAVGVVAGAQDHESADAAAKAYGAVVRAIMGQQATLSTLAARGTAWQGEEYSLLPFEDSYTQVGGRVTFTVTVDDVLTTMSVGPITPSDDPTIAPDPEPTVAEDGVTITLENLTDD